MTKDEIIFNISNKNFNKDYFIRLALESKIIRDEYIHLLLNHKHIMVYYHLFYVLDQCTAEKPQLFYVYFNDLKKLLHNKNSYHRDIGITLIANLAIVDKNNLINEIIDDYLKLLHDEKFMTSQCLVKNLGKIIDSKEKLVKKASTFLIEQFTLLKYKEKQKDLLQGDIINTLERAYIKKVNKRLITQYVKGAIDSRSPKCRKIAKDFIKKYSL